MDGRAPVLSSGKPLSAVMQRARDWLSFSSPRQPGWALVRDLAAENDVLTMENDSLRDAREELVVLQVRYAALREELRWSNRRLNEAHGRDDD